jgi:hypothetical protein
MPADEIRLAGPGDVDAAVEVLAEATAWLRSRGIVQWPARFSMAFMLEHARRGELYVAISQGEVVGTVTLQWSDPAFWGERADAGFVHRVAVSRSRPGLGKALIDWAAGQAVDRERNFLCLDCLSGNTRLRRYYEDLGFCAVGEIVGPPDHPTDPALEGWRATLYEKPLGARV